MTIHLDEDIFEYVKHGTKNVEVRVNDEKRRRLKVGDKITFLMRPNDVESLDAVIEDLIYYKTFEDLVKDYTEEELYSSEYTKEEFLTLLKRFYTDEEIEKYGTVAIKFRII
ncbi:MAG: ASCH domain-containing protein [Bacilli bacterium]|nr:ASCH domain-containing protein [Bacilli bacterium]